MVFDALQIDLDGVADLDLGGLARLGEFLGRDLAFGLEADVDDRKVVFDGNDLALDHRAFGSGMVGIALGKEGFEIVTGGIEGHGGFRHRVHVPSKNRGWPGGKPARTSGAAPLLPKRGPAGKPRRVSGFRTAAQASGIRQSP
jgi:hypothetical protein